MDAWFEANPGPPATVSDVADHIDHVREVAGIDHVGIGSDFDGTPTMPDGLQDVSRYPVLFEELASRSYGDEDLKKIAGRSVLRVCAKGSGRGLAYGPSARHQRRRSRSWTRPELFRERPTSRRFRRWPGMILGPLPGAAEFTRRVRRDTPGSGRSTG